jgi:DnaA family protein
MPVMVMPMAAELAQLALPVHLSDDATLDNFLFSAELGPLRNMLEAQTSRDGEPAIFLHGLPGSGRSHLLQAACHALPGGDALYLPLDQLSAMAPDQVLDGIEDLSRVCLDNLHAVVGAPDWELALFDFINRARERGCRLLISARVAPRQLAVNLPDLASRLSWGVVFRLPAPADADKLAILKFRAGRRGLLLEDEAARYILSRAPRSMSALMGLLEQLDRDAMALQRTLTIPFIKGRLDW